jgi:hypothetical protein
MTEELQKMAVIHDDARVPKIVYRVENHRGETPYRYKGKDHGVDLNQGQTFQAEYDFEEHPKEFASKKLLYGFEHPRDAESWFGNEGLSELQNQGFTISAVPASKVYRGESGSQVMFEPHYTYHPGKHPSVSKWHEPGQDQEPKQPSLGTNKKKLPTLGKSETDGHSILLDHHDPRERKLALKSHGVTPAHLRLALQDPDPDVREAAAHHPSLTPELIEEVMRSDDTWLAEQVLQRPDLRSQDLEAAIDNPELQATVARHWALSPEQREHLESHPDLDAVSKEHARQSGELLKNVGFLTYPQLGHGQVPQQTMVWPREEYRARIEARGQGPVSVKESGHTSTKINSNHREGLEPDRRFLTQGARPVASPGFHESVRHRMFGEAPIDRKNLIQTIAAQAPKVKEVVRNKILAATDDHEAQHGLFYNMAHKHGTGVRNRVLLNTYQGISDQDRREVVDAIRDSMVQGLDDHEKQEEGLTHLQSYLQNPDHRTQVHRKLNLGTTSTQHEFMARARKTWEALRHKAQTIKPEDVGMVVKSESEEVEAWLSKSEAERKLGGLDTVAEHLGSSSELEVWIAAAEFLTGKKLEPAAVRARMLDVDDPKQAVLLAAGLAPEDMKDLEAVVDIKELNKSEEDAPDIKAVFSSGEKMAEVLRGAYARGEAEPINLGGKHSKGTMLFRDEDGRLYLLKPGSGKNSPAAGVSEEKASMSRREVAFDSVARAWGLGNSLPDVQLLLVGGREVAAFTMLPLTWGSLYSREKQHPGSARRALAPYLNQGMLHRWAVLDNVLGNPDRHGGNLLVGPEDDGNRVALIDHGSAFAGVDFNPSHDGNSFVPYYLRVWGPNKGWSAASSKEKLGWLPTLASETDSGLRDWILSLDPNRLTQELHRYGIDPAASVARLKAIQEALSSSESASHLVNRFWVE